MGRELRKEVFPNETVLADSRYFSDYAKVSEKETTQAVESFLKKQYLKNPNGIREKYMDFKFEGELAK